MASKTTANRLHTRASSFIIPLVLSICVILVEWDLLQCAAPTRISMKVLAATAPGFVVTGNKRTRHVGLSHTTLQFRSRGSHAPSTVCVRQECWGRPHHCAMQPNGLSLCNQIGHWRLQSRMVRSATENPLDGASELSSTLALLDRQWKIQKRSSRANEGFEWERMNLDSDQTEGDSEESPTREPKDKSTLDESENDAENEKRDYIFLLEPPPSVSPSSVIVFLGGAVLGQFPHIAYSELLKRVGRKLNAAVIAVPYSTGLDHLEISQKSAELIRRAIIKCEDDRGYFENIPKFAVGHSLGAKLHTLICAATGIGDDFSGIGYLCYNNFGFVDTIRMARQFAAQLRSGDSTFASRMQNDKESGEENPFRGSEENVVDTLLDFAQQAIGFVGLEFSPSPADTSRIIERKFQKDLQAKTRLFVFDKDDLDSTPSFVESCRVAVGGEGETPVTVSALPGTHLTPVFIQFGLEEIPAEMRSAASEMMGGFRGGSFGSEEELNGLVQEICNWVLGKPPTQQSSNKLKEALSGSPRQLPGDVLDANPVE